MIATQEDYQVATVALAEVIARAIKDNVPPFLMGQVSQHQDLINQITAKGGKSVVDAVENARKQRTIAGPG